MLPTKPFTHVRNQNCIAQPIRIASSLLKQIVRGARCLAASANGAEPLPTGR